MRKNPRPEEENIIEDKINLFRLKKETKAINDRILENIKNLFKNEKEEENYHKPERVNNFWSNNYIEYESNDDRNETLSVEEYLNRSRPYLKDIINNLKKSDTWKIQLTIANNVISSIDYGVEHVIHSKSDNIEIMIDDQADEVIKDLFNSLKNRHQNNLESMKGNEFVFDWFFYCIINVTKENPNCGGSYIDSPKWMKNKKATINPINKKDNKCF